MSKQFRKKFNVLIIGAGRIGAFHDSPKSAHVLSHAHAFSKHPGFNLLGFVDSDKAAAKRAAGIWGGSVFNSIPDAFRQEKIDIAVNATPDGQHYQILKQLLGYQVKLIFAEKPLTKNSWQAAEIISLAKARKIKIVANYHRRFVPEFQQLAKDIKSRKYGRYLTGTGYYGKGIKHNGSHLLDLLRFFIGEIKKFIIVGKDFDFTPDDPSVYGLLKFADTKPFYLQHIDHRDYTIFEIDLLFSKGRVRVVDTGFSIEIFKVRPNRVFAGYQNIESLKVKKTNQDKALLFAAARLYGYLTHPEQKFLEFEDGLRTLELAESLLK